MKWICNSGDFPGHSFGVCLFVYLFFDSSDLEEVGRVSLTASPAPGLEAKESERSWAARVPQDSPPENPKFSESVKRTLGAGAGDTPEHKDTPFVRLCVQLKFTGPKPSGAQGHRPPPTLPASVIPDVMGKQQHHAKEEVAFVSALCSVRYVGDDTCSTTQVNSVRRVLAAR